LRKPVVELFEKPSRITKSVISDSEVLYSANFRLRIRSRDEEDTHVILNTVSLVARQGRGLRSRELCLSRDSKRTDSSLIVKPKHDETIQIFLRNNQYSQEWKTDINLDKPYRWEIDNIVISLRPSISKALSFTGKAE